MSQAGCITASTGVIARLYQPGAELPETPQSFPVLKTYLPILVFAFLGLAVASVFMVVNHLVGPKKPKLATAASRRQGEPYESGIPVEAAKGLKFGVSFYLLAMLFILFDIEVVFLYPVGVLLNASDSVFVLAEIILFVFVLLVGFVYVWRRGALNWR